MDFIERLITAIRELNLSITTKIGNVGTTESAGIYSMPGGQVTKRYMDGMKEEVLNFEYVIKSKNEELANNQLWQISDFLEQLDDLPSSNGSYDFEQISITSKPAQSQADEQGFYYWVVDFTVQLTTYKR